VSANVCMPKPYSAEELANKAESNDMLPRQFRIKSLNWETGAGDVYTWELEALDGKPFSFQPGQFNMLHLHGKGEVPISICSSNETGQLLHTTRAVGGVTEGMKNLKVGDLIGVRGPFGTHWPVEDAKGKDVVIMAGGMGLPPLRPVIYHILKHRADFNKVFLCYGARTPHDIVFKAELESWHHDHEIEVLVTVDKKEGNWEGDVGVVTQLLSRVDVDANNALAMICGPEIMMHYCQLSLHKMGLADDQLVVSMERNMKCAIGHCGHCQWGPKFICKDGPVFYFNQISDLFKVHEL